MTKYISIVNIILVLLFCGCNSQNNQEVTTDDRKNTDSIVDLSFDPNIELSSTAQNEIKFDSCVIETFFKIHEKFTPYKKELLKFYRGRAFAFAWFDNDSITERGEHLYFRITLLNKNDIKDSTLYYAEFVNMMDAEKTKQNDVAMLDVMLTAQYLHYSHTKVKGNISESQARSLDWMIPRSKVDPIALLIQIVNENRLVFENEPLRKQYTELKKQLEFMHDRGLDTVTGIKPIQRTYKYGDSSKVLLQVRQRLELWGDISKSNQSAVLDSQLYNGIQSFQARFGIEMDGIAGPVFFRELNISGHDRVKQILINLERLRWLPSYNIDEHLIVNIPAFTLYAYNGDSLEWEMKVIVGQILRKTVIFSDEISYIDFSPYWYIPPGIMRRDVLPALIRDSHYLVKKNMERIGGTDSNPRIRQRPGGDNPMGKVKFMFPNIYHIYLHDSHAKELFNKSSRSFSAGCIRVADAEFLANYLLKDQPDWTKDKINAAMNADKQQRVIMKKKMPVYITYLTAFTDNNGLLNFRPDIYDMDRKLALLLFKN